MKSRDDKSSSRGLRVLGAAAKALALAVVFVAATFAGVLVHAGFRAPRELTLAKVNDALHGAFQGEVEILRVRELRMNRLGGVDAEVRDPEGERVLLVRGVDAKIATASLLRSLVTGSALSVTLPDLHVGFAEVVVDKNEAGELRIERAFAPKEPPSGEPSPSPDIDIPRIAIDHAWVHGRATPDILIDADLDELRGAFRYASDTLQIDVDHVALAARGLGALTPDATIEAHASLPEDASARRVSFDLDGTIGEIPIRARGSMIGSNVDGMLDIPETDASAFNAIAPDVVRLGAPVAAHLEVRGQLPVLEPELDARIGDGELLAEATIRIPDEASPLRAAARVFVRNIDASLLHDSAPPTDVTASLDALVAQSDGGAFSGTFALQSEPGVVADEIVPAVITAGAFTERSVHGAAHIAERGAPTNATFAFLPQRPNSAPDLLTFSIETRIPSLAGIERVGPIGKGSANVSAKGTVDTTSHDLLVSVDAAVAGFSASGVSLDRARMAATLRGTLEVPTFSATMHGDALGAGGFVFPTVEARASGSPSTIVVGADLGGSERAPSIKASGTVTTESGIGVHGGRVEVTRQDVTAVATIGSVAVRGSTVDVRKIAVEGLGAPLLADVNVAGSALSIRANSDGVDLARVAVLAARDGEIAGRVTLDIDAKADRGGTRGHANVDVHGLRVKLSEAGDSQIALVFDGRRVLGGGTLDLGPLGHAGVASSGVTLAGPLLDVASWKNAYGEVAFDGDVDLAKVMERIPAEKRPVSQASGRLVMRGKVSRETSRATPSGNVEIETSKLELVAANGKKIAGFDGKVKATFDATSGAAIVQGTVQDGRGPLVAFKATGKPPLDRLIAGRANLQSLLDLPVEAHLEIPRRSLSDMPKELGKMPVEGEIQLVADLRGTVRAPTVTLSAKGHQLAPRDAPTCTRKIDVALDATYGDRRGQARLTATSGQAEVVLANVEAQVNLDQAIAERAPLEWKASGDVELRDFPLDLLEGVLRRPFGGTVSGKVAVHDLHGQGALEGKLTLEDLAVDRAKIATGEVALTVKDSRFVAEAKLEQTDGHFDVKVTGAAAWGKALAPKFDLRQAIDVAMNAKNFRINAAKPFLEDVFAELDGRIDAQTKIHIEPGAKNGTMDGAVAIREGVLEIPQVGERFHGITGELIVRPWGTVRLDKLEARGPTGRLTASAEAVLDGLVLKSAKAKIVIPKGESIPIAVEGVPMGRAYGEVTATAAMTSPDRLDVKVDVPLLKVDLPRSIGHSVQSLEPDKNISVGYFDGKEFVGVAMKKPEEPRKPSDLEVRAEVKLGNDVEIKRDTTVQVRLRGGAVVEVSDDTRVTGEIRLVRGKIELQGKLFTIERGVVSFVGSDPSNPLIQATAYWDAPDRTRVYADFIGLVSSGKLTLRSEPAMSQDEILALVMFGSSSGSFGSSTPSQQGQTGVAAVGVAGGVVTEGLNKAISGFTSNLSTRIDTSEAGSPQPQLVMQITKSVSASLGYKIGNPAPGADPDRAELTVDWRFFRNWSLGTSLGDHGSTSVDVVWRMRY